MRKSLPVAVLVLSAIMWGLTWWPLKHFHQQGLQGPLLILLGYGVVALVLLPWLWRERAAWRREARYMWLMLLLGGWANLAFAGAMIYGEVVRAMMLFYLAPVWGVLGGRLFLREPIDRRRGLGLGLALAGAFLVLGGWEILRQPPAALDLLALSAGMAFALNNITCRAAQAVPVTSKSAINFLGVGLMALAVVLTQGLPLPPLSLSTWGWLLFFALGWLLLATVSALWAVTHLEAGRAAVILIVELLAAVVSATLVGGETLAANEWAGGALILAAAVLESRRGGEHLEPVIPPAADRV